MTLSKCIKFAKTETARAKAVKAWRLRKADKNLQAIDMPKGYIIATDDEVREILIKAGKKPLPMKADDRKILWALSASFPETPTGRVTISFAPITSVGNN